MAKSSKAYARMKRALFDQVAAIPSGRVVEVSALAAALNIPSRHAAYILSQMTDDELQFLPRHRVVPRAGRFPKPEKQSAQQKAQIALLVTENLFIKPNGQIDQLHKALLPLKPEHRNTVWADEEDV